MLSQIPTHLIAGPLGAGKTSLLQAVLAQRPTVERWAILINEFGQIGLDQALLGASADDGVSLSEIPGGCLCCVNGVPFQVGLTRLLRKARPDRLWIECSGLGHPVSLLQQLADPPWQGVLDLQPLVMVCEASQLLTDESLPAVQLQALPLAGLLIANKADQLDHLQQQALQARWPDAVLCQHAAVPLHQLPGASANSSAAATNELPTPSLPTIGGQIWRDNAPWVWQSQLTQAPYSIGWRVTSQSQFRRDAVQHWLKQYPFLRAKGVLNTDAGWRSFNLLGNPTPDSWQQTPWRRDNRLELILATKPDCDALDQGLRACLLSQ